MLYPVMLLFPRYKRLWWQGFRQSLERAGSAFIKFGQWLSTRQDLFPAEMCDELSELKSRAPEHTYEVTSEVIKTAFGMEMDELFVHVEKVPIASGSIAQVYRATLHPSVVATLPYSLRHRRTLKKSGWLSRAMRKVYHWGLGLVAPELANNAREEADCPKFEVAVKVRHPWVVDQICEDMMILYWISNKISCMPMFEWMDMPVNVDEFAKGLAMQVDLTLEAANLDRFNENFMTVPNVTFPKPVDSFVHSSVLIETFEEGTPITQYTEYPHPANRLLAKIGLNSYLKMVIQDNFIHADCHSENILVNIDSNNRPNVVMLDVGLVTELTPDEQVNIIRLMKSMSTGDGEFAANTMLDISLKSNGGTLTHIPNEQIVGFKDDMKVLFGRVFEDEYNLSGKIEMGGILTQVFQLLRKHEIKFDCNYVMLAVSMAVVEGLARKLDPTLNLLNSVQPYVMGHLNPISQLKALARAV